MTCICVLTAFRPRFPHLETLKKILENSTLSRYVKKKKKKKKKSWPTDPIFKFWSGEGNITFFFFGLTLYLGMLNTIRKWQWIKVRMWHSEIWYNLWDFSSTQAHWNLHLLTIGYLADIPAQPALLCSFFFAINGARQNFVMDMTEMSGQEK